LKWDRSGHLNVTTGFSDSNIFDLLIWPIQFGGHPNGYRCDFFLVEGEGIVKRKIAWQFFSLFLGGFLLAAGGASAQTIAYRQTNLASDVNAPGFADNVDLSLRNPWGIAFLPRGSFFIANANI